MNAHPDGDRLRRTARAYLHAADDPLVRDRFEGDVRQDFIAGRITEVDGWVVADTELALLGLMASTDGLGDR